MIRNHILSTEPTELGASCVDIYLVGYVAQEFGPGRETFFKYIFDKKITDKTNSANAIWTVGRGDGQYLNILNEDGTIKDYGFIHTWLYQDVDGCWLNIDLPTKTVTLHRLNCTNVISRKESIYKGINILRRDGGWLYFESKDDADLFCVNQYAGYKKIPHC